jgi:hypothetical protein
MAKSHLIRLMHARDDRGMMMALARHLSHRVGFSKSGCEQQKATTLCNMPVLPSARRSPR